MDFEAAYARYAALSEEALREALALPQPALPGADALLRAMGYSLFAGGKRLRPVLLLSAYRMFSKDLRPALPFAAAIEMIHTYSLIHDDLPAMDDDDLRRGLPTSHRVFGEAVAILAGDALLNGAYELMSASSHPRALKALREIALRAGALGMIAGQAADIGCERKAADAETVAYIHRHKTADLMIAPVLCAMTLAGAGEEELEAGYRYGYNLGMAFQIVDDLLDLTGQPASLGKDSGKDSGAGKMTWPGTHGGDQAAQDARRFTLAAEEAARFFGGRGSFLAELAQRALTRVQ